MNYKSETTSTLLALLFGPLGMVYASFTVGFAYFLLNAVLVCSVVGMPLVLVTWLVGIFHARRIVAEHNENLRLLLKGSRGATI